MSQEILQYYQISAKKRFGQNFLMDHDALKDIATAVNLHDKHVIEIGPGYGALTEHIWRQSPASLTLVELDTDMVHIMENRLHTSSPFFLGAGAEQIQILHKDVLEIQALDQKSIIVANIPYYITSPILTHFLITLHSSTSDMVIMMQKEVADKIISRKGKHSYLSLSCYLFCTTIERVRQVSRTLFSPSPKVDSSVLLFRTDSMTPEELAKRQSILQLASKGFREPRKKVLSNLAKQGGYEKQCLEDLFDHLGLSHNLRAEDLSIDNWQDIITMLQDRNSTSPQDIPLNT